MLQEDKYLILCPPLDWLFGPSSHTPARPAKSKCACFAEGAVVSSCVRGPPWCHAAGGSSPTVYIRCRAFLAADLLCSTQPMPPLLWRSPGGAEGEPHVSKRLCHFCSLEWTLERAVTEITQRLFYSVHSRKVLLPPCRRTTCQALSPRSRFSRLCWG